MWGFSGIKTKHMSTKGDSQDQEARAPRTRRLEYQGAFTGSEGWNTREHSEEQKARVRATFSGTCEGRTRRQHGWR